MVVGVLFSDRGGLFKGIGKFGDWFYSDFRGCFVFRERER